MVGQPSGGTEEHLAQARKLKAEIYILVDRAPVQEKVRKPAGIVIRGAPYKAITSAQPLDRSRIRRDRVVSEA